MRVRLKVPYVTNFQDSRRFRADPQGACRRGLRHADADPDPGDPDRAEGPRPGRPRADRHRQDRGVRAADPRPARTPTANTPARSRAARWCSRRRANSPRRSATASAPMAASSASRPPSCSAAPRWSSRSRRSSAASTSSSPRRAGCSTTSASARCASSKVEILVLDEADHMLDMGFIHDLRRIATLLPKQRQSLFFSATMPAPIAELAAQFLDNPERVAVAPPSTTAERVEQAVIHVDQSKKQDLLHALLERQVDQARAGVHPHQARRRPRREEARERRLRRRGHPRQQEPGPAHARARRLQEGQGAPAGRHRNRRARHRRRRHLATSSTTICRTCPSNTCTASAAPRAPAQAAWPSPSARPTSAPTCATSSA